MKRRAFIQLSSAAAIFLAFPKRVLGWLFGKEEPVRLQERVYDLRALDPKSKCCYIYNPGIDIDGVWDLTKQINTIPGGKITKISTVEENLGSNCFGDWKFTPILPALAAKGLARKQERRKEVSYWSTYSLDENGFKELDEPILETSILKEVDTIITHSATTLIDCLLQQRFAHSPAQLIWIKEWDNKDVDVKSINDYIAADTIEKRERNIRALPNNWSMSPVFKAAVLPAVISFAETGKDVLVSHTGRLFSADTYTRNMCLLLGIKGKDLVFQQSYPTFSDEDPSIIAGIKERLKKAEPENHGRDETYFSEGGKFPDPRPVAVRLQEKLDNRDYKIGSTAHTAFREGVKNRLREAYGDGLLPPVRV